MLSVQTEHLVLQEQFIRLPLCWGLVLGHFALLLICGLWTLHRVVHGVTATYMQRVAV